MNSIESAFFNIDRSFLNTRVEEITNKKIEETTEKIIKKILQNNEDSFPNWSYIVSSHDIYIYNTSFNHLNSTTQRIFQDIIKNVSEEIKPYLFIRERLIKIIAFPFMLELEIELDSIYRSINNNIITYP